MTSSFDIVDLIENNPITKLSTTYQNNLLTKIKTKFTENEQQIFVASFYGFLKYDSKTDFVIDLDDVWKWLKFSTKQKAKMLLENFFVIEIDYKILPNLEVKQTLPSRGGHNKEIIMLNIATFKKFCLKAGTIRADEIHGRGTCVPPQTPLINVVQKTNDFLHLFLSTLQKEGCGELRSPGWSAKKWINCK
jgi:hypothetical protein